MVYCIERLPPHFNHYGYMSNPNPYSNLHQTLIITAALILTSEPKITLKLVKVSSKA